MNIVNYIKNFIFKITHKSLLLPTPNGIYNDLISKQKIDSIINNIPENLSETEKGYQIYLELGKILSENPEFVFTDEEGKYNHYNDIIDENYYGICKSIGELYVSTLKKIGIDAYLVKRHPGSKISHVDIILKLDNKFYIANLIADLSKIKTNSRTTYFGFDLRRPVHDPDLQKSNEYYLSRLEKRFGKISHLSKETTEQMDKKLGYSYSTPPKSNNMKRGIYTNDTIDLLSNDMNNPSVVKKYILHDKDVPESDILKYKLDYIFENIHNLTDYNSELNYLENIRYYLYITRHALSGNECERIHPYVATVNNDMSNIISILKVRPSNYENNNGRNFYYMYSTNEKKYIEKTPGEMKQYVDSFDKDSLRIIGELDYYKPQSLDELEL